MIAPSPSYATPTRRRPGLASAASLLLGAALVAALGWTAGTQWRPLAPGTTAQQAVTPTGNVRAYTLTAQAVDWELFPGTTVKAWTYNGQMPGPEIRVAEGDLVRVTLRNELPVPTTIHWHGIDVPNAMDGVPGLTQLPTLPGESFTYEFLATNPGTRWYHPHQDSSVQTPLGLFGAFIVEPRTPPAGSVTYDREYAFVLSEWASALTPAVAEGEQSLPLSGPGAPHSKQPDFDVFLFNGKAGTGIPPMVVRQDERIRIRLINAGALVHTIHLHGQSFKVIATDGNFIPPANQLLKDSVTLGPSERVDLEVFANNPGVWMFHCHMQHHAENGMMTTLNYEGVAPPIQDGGHVHGAPAAPPAPPVPHAHPPVATEPALQPVAVDGVRVAMVDNRFQPSVVSVPAGATVTWVNSGINAHTVSTYDGAVESGSVNTTGTFAATFATPGEYRYLCRQHLLSGMFGTIKVL